MKYYVGTYAKYNAGNLHGAWLDLEDYADLDDFYEACKELHSDEEDPEFQFQDYEGPKFLYSEHSIPDDIYEFLDLSGDDQNMVEAYAENVGYNNNLSDLIEKARDDYRGQYDSWKDFAEDYVTECVEVPEHLRGYIDYGAYARDLQHDHFESNGYFFYSR